MSAYRILARKRAGQSLSTAEIRAVVDGAVDGSWSEGQLAAFLMAGAIRGFDRGETRDLTLAMLESGDSWDLKADFPTLGDKHSTGGVGDKVSLILSPLLAACGQPVVMLTGRALGHTGGTADKLETISGVRLDLDRGQCVRLLADVGMAIGIATPGIAPADRVLYRLRDQTATVESLPFITASILSKKLATGAAALALDVKTGNGAFMPRVEDARELARSLVTTARDLGCRASALLTDMSQPLGEWVGHHSEVREAVDCLAGRETESAAGLMEVTLALAEEVCRLTNAGIERRQLEDAIASGRARERFARWVEAQGGDPSALEPASLPLAPGEAVIAAAEEGHLTAVDTRQLGLLLGEAAATGGGIDPGVALRYRARLGDRLQPGQEIARLYLRRRDEEMESRFQACFTIGEPVVAPAPVGERVDGD